ncbi:hypothetical protein [Streptomyces sp. NBC_00620]|uniref:hypothetical protein n=1 Tax=Streptomyces sp. NBC_00620 TaxID=2903666 RepID=UPI0022546E3A|nr:hypothetical protein [Streptomyces sp. NBC_00620]MCX4971299.1 hypothetical protein [Streptomyces sp. NBC_00620]
MRREKGHILENPNGMTPRAASFLGERATRVPRGRENLGEQADFASAAACFGVELEEVVLRASWIGQRFGGLRYRSDSWSFEEEIGFFPSLDFDEEDDGILLSLIEHTVAHPFGVWVNLDGVVYFMFPEVEGGDYVKAFGSVEGMIESDALHSECMSWDVAGRGGAESLDEVRGRCRNLQRAEEVDGSSEAWFFGDGFRVHIWETWANVFARDELSRWAVWACDPAGRENARRFLLGVL